MENKMREMIAEMGRVLPDVVNLTCDGLQGLREGLMERGFTREEAMALLIAQVGSGEPFMKVGG